jgi:hypothetical protein
VNQKFPTEAILSLLTKVRASMPRIATALPPPPEDGAPLDPANTVEDFEYQAVLDVLEMVTTELNAALDVAHARVTADALALYYAAEELAGNPAHADVIPHVEAMRQAYEREYGQPIPPRVGGSMQR